MHDKSHAKANGMTSCPKMVLLQSVHVHVCGCTVVVTITKQLPADITQALKLLPTNYYMVS